MTGGASDIARATASWAGPLNVLVAQQGSGGAALHHVAGLLHATNGDDASLGDWLRLAASALGTGRIAYVEYDLTEKRAARAIAHPSGGGAWCEPLVPLAELRNAGAGDAFVRANAARDLYVAAVRCLGDVAQVVAVAREPAADAGETLAHAQALTALLWHLHCLRDRRVVRGVTAVELLGVLPVPAGLTDGAGRAIECNGAFGQFMDAAGMRLATGRLRFDDPYLQDSWQVALTEVVATALAESMLTATPGGQWRVHLMPLRCALDQHDTRERTMVLVVAEQLAMGAEVAFEAAMASAARPLTQAESEVLNALLQGHPAKIIANARGASVNTVRSQIMTILEKTGHHNQKALMAAFSSSTFGASGFSGLSSTPARKR